MPRCYKRSIISKPELQWRWVFPELTVNKDSLRGLQVRERRRDPAPGYTLFDASSPSAGPYRGRPCPAAALPTPRPHPQRWEDPSPAQVHGTWNRGTDTFSVNSVRSCSHHCSDRGLAVTMIWAHSLNPLHQPLASQLSPAQLSSWQEKLWTHNFPGKSRPSVVLPEPCDTVTTRVTMSMLINLPQSYFISVNQVLHEYRSTLTTERTYFYVSDTELNFSVHWFSSLT